MHYGNLANDIVQRDVGLISGLRNLQTNPGEPKFSIVQASLGDVSQALPNVAFDSRFAPGISSLDGAGGGLTDEDARLRAIGESLERYCTCVYDERQFILATARELGNDALDLDTIPRCSTSELCSPRCPLITPNKAAPIRWVKASRCSMGGWSGCPR
jgi:ribosomal protein S12 methylthiotransferase accessory factor